MAEQPRFYGAREAPSAASRPRFTSVLRACRPRQWAKNTLVLAAPCSAGLITRPLVAAQVLGAFIVLCMISSSTYLVNDVRDRDQDRTHPRKRHRPVAAGDLTPRAASRIAIALAVAGVVLAAVVSPALALLACGYLALTASYSFWLRRVFIADMLAIAAGFVMRAFAGGAATDIYLSRWFVIVTACCAAFLVAAKRYAELGGERRSLRARATLARYSRRGLLLTLALAALLGSSAYAGWAFTRPEHLVWYALSIAPFVLWLGRYVALMRTGAGEAPEEVVLRDRALLSLGAVWGFLFLGGVYVGG